MIDLRYVPSMNSMRLSSTKSKNSMKMMEHDIRSVIMADMDLLYTKTTSSRIDE